MQALSAIIVFCFCLSAESIYDSLGLGWLTFWGVVLLGGAAFVAGDTHRYRRNHRND